MDDMPCPKGLACAVPGGASREDWHIRRREHSQQVHEEEDLAKVSWFQAFPGLSLAWVQEAPGDRREARILDVGCGGSFLVDHLLDRGYSRLALLDVSERVFGQVRRHLGPRQAGVEWFATDLLESAAPHRLDLWHDRAVLHFLCDAGEQRRYAQVLREALAADGYALNATFAIGGPTRCSGLDIVQYDAQRLLGLLGEELRLVREQQVSQRAPGGREPGG